MDRDKFMELVYETFADEPDNVLANGIIEASDSYAEHEKAQLFQEGTTSDLISRQAARHALCKAVHKGEDVPCENQTASCLWTGTRVCDFVREIDALPTIQPQSTVGQLNDGAQSTNLIDRQQAIDAANDWYEGLICGSINGLIKRLNALQPVQPEPTYEQVEEYCKRRCLHVVTDDFFESTKPQRLGHWIPHETPDDGEQYECSECGVLWEFNDGTPEDNEAHYCPKCGAKMKGATT